jgi:endonuclease/exonuclease/phosphatase family metal-dependent hydrolase
LDIRLINLSIPYREPRGAIDVQLDLYGQPIRVLVSHLGLRRAERRLQIRKLLEVINERESSLTILLSDVNEWLFCDRSFRLLAQCLQKCSHHRTFPSFLPLLSLDRICISPAEAVMNIEVHNTPAARIASDHLPLKALLNLRRAAAKAIQTPLPRS